MRKNIGLITYHSAYNYGSVLQAFATQHVVESLDNNVTVVDYRPVSGDNYYRKLYRVNYGLRTFIGDLSMLPVYKQRKLRMNLFENFISNKLHLTAKTYQKPEDLSQLANAFDLTISGSDQVINKHSNELSDMPWSYMDPYLLTWSKAPKASFGSSPATMSDSELNKISDKLKDFFALSVREENANQKISKATGKPVTTVCDPTLLLTSREWRDETESCVDLSHINVPQKYIVFYTLTRPSHMFRLLPQLKQLSRRLGYQILAIAPFAGFVPPSRELINALAVGPAEFVSLFSSAAAVITDSYHGTLFAINFNKPFWTLTNRPIQDELGSRKGQVLFNLSLQARFCNDISGISSIEELDYSKANQRLDGFRKSSIDFLQTTISSAHR